MWPKLEQIDQQVNWSSWQLLLHDKQQEGWQEIQASAVGHLLVANQDGLSYVLGDLASGPGERVQANLLALSVSAIHGAAEAIATQLHHVDLERLPVQRIRPFGVLLSEAAATLTPDSRRSLLHHIQGALREHPEILLPLIVALFDETTWNSGLVVTALQAAPVGRRPETVRQLLKRATVDIHPILLRNLTEFFSNIPTDRSWEEARIEFYGAAAADSAPAVAGLLEAANGNAETTAAAAARHLVGLVGTTPDVGLSQLVVLTRSRFSSVRLSALEAMFRVLDVQGPFPPSHLDEIATTLISESVPAVWHALLKLADRYASLTGSLPSSTLDLVEIAVTRALSQTGPGQAITRAILGLLKTLAQGEDLALDTRLHDWVRRLFTSIDTRRIRDGEGLAADLAAALGRHDRAFLDQLVSEPSGLPPSNLAALAMAIRRVEGSGSRLLDQLLSNPACPDSVVRLILQWRGA